MKVRTSMWVEREDEAGEHLEVLVRIRGAVNGDYAEIDEVADSQGGKVDLSSKEEERALTCLHEEADEMSQDVEPYELEAA